MIELIVSFCIVGQPLSCTDVHVETQARTVRECSVAAQPVMAQVAREHPAWEIKRYWCEFASPSKDT